MRQRRFERHNHGDRAPVVLPATHPAIIEARPLFKGWRGDSLLRKGMHSRKTGWKITKGAWSGFNIFTLTLPERTTCPSTCAHWFDCYGNNMPHPKRAQPGPLFEAELEREVMALDKFYSRVHAARGRGFVVRLHLLGDFYSVPYVQLWATMLKKYPRLHAWGYTAWQRGTPIGDAVHKLRSEQWARFAVRHSDGPDDAPRTASIPTRDTNQDVIICPAQTHAKRDAICCATCALCWSTARAIAFVDHHNL